MKVVLTGLMSSPDYVPRMFLAIAWLSLDIRNHEVSDVIESLNRQA